MRIKLFIVLILCSTGSWGQELILRQYTTSDGLASSTVYPMMQDKDGFIWFGTDLGVTRFDGMNFQHFSLKDGLSDNFILKVKQDSRGKIWFLGYNGTVSYWLGGRIFNSESDTLLRHIVSTGSFIDLFEDNKQRLWFLSNTQHKVLDNDRVIDTKARNELRRLFLIVNAKQGPVLLGDLSISAQFTQIGIQPLHLRYTMKDEGGYSALEDGSVLFAAEKGLVWQKDTAQQLVIPFARKFSTRLGSITISSDSLVWIAVPGEGVYCYNLKKPLKEPIIYLKDKNVVGVLADKEGNLWICTSDEGFFLIPVWGEKITLCNTKSGLADERCYALSKNKNGEYVVGMNNGSVGLISSKKTLEVKLPKMPEANRIIRILVEGNNIWIGTDFGLVHYNSKTGCNHFLKNSRRLSKTQYRNVKDFTISGEKLIIAGSFFHLAEYPIHCPGEDTEVNILQTTPRLYSVYVDYKGILWYSTITGLQSKNGARYIDHSGRHPLLGKRINSIAETADSTLILATHGYGLIFYKAGKVMKRYFSENGLANDVCRRLTVYKNYIYVSTPSGVSVLEYNRGKVLSIQNLHSGNFLPSNDVHDVYADQEEIAVATMRGVVVIRQSALQGAKPTEPLLYITDIRVNNRPNYDLSKNLTYRENSLKFNFIGIYFRQPKEVNYRYRLNRNQNWQFTQNTELEFSLLPPGNYEFQLQARVKTGPWSPVRNLSFSISPPFWETLWFRLLVIVTSVLLIYTFIWQKLNRLRKKKEEIIRVEQQMADLEQQALQSMMNPHFIFNVMNSIQHFINSNDKDSANRYLTDFANLIRMNLNISFKKQIPLLEEVEYLNIYLSFEKLRFGENLEYSIETDPDIDLDETTIPVMMIQPFVENAVWHGIVPSKTKGQIVVRIIKVTEGLIKVLVSDNGVGIKEAYINSDIGNHEKQSHAMSMTLQRLRLMEKSTGVQLSLQYSHADPGKANKGTVVELLLPATFY